MEAIVAHTSLNFAGGGEFVCLFFIDTLRKKGHQVTLATIDKTNWAFLKKTFGDISLPNKEIYLFSVLPTFPAPLHDLIIFSFFTLEMLFLRIVGRKKILINTCGEKIDSIADLTYINGVPIRCVHNIPVGVKKKCFGKLWNFVLKILDKVNTTCLVVNSKFVSKMVKEKMNKRNIVIHPPVRLEKFSFAFSNDKRHNIVLNVSRFLPEQDLHKVLCIAKFVSDAEFLMIGQSSIRSKAITDKLKSGIKHGGLENKVKILENISFPEYLKLVSSAKVILRTLPHETFGISVVEGMAAGCVPVVPRNGGPWLDVLGCKQGVYGFSYSSVKEAASIIDRLLNDEKLRVEVAARAVERTKIFDSSVFERKILDVVDKVFKAKFRTNNN